MSKKVFVVSFECKAPINVLADTMQVTGSGLVFYEDGRTGPVARFTNYVSVLLEADPGLSRFVEVAEPIRALGAVSCFSSPASPLVEAVESTARLVWDAPQGEDRKFLRAHLARLIGEQLRCLVPPVPPCSFQGGVPRER